MHKRTFNRGTVITLHRHNRRDLAYDITLGELADGFAGSGQAIRAVGGSGMADIAINFYIGEVLNSTFDARDIPLLQAVQAHVLAGLEDAYHRAGGH